MPTWTPAVLFVLLIVVVVPFAAWHFHHYFDRDENGECTYDRLAREQAERRSAGV